MENINFQLEQGILLTYYNIIRYTGEIKNGLRHGTGKFYNADGHLVYDGAWFNGLKHGIGKLDLKDQLVYVGDWYEGIRHGMGRITWPSKNFYEGEL